MQKGIGHLRSGALLWDFRLDLHSGSCGTFGRTCPFPSGWGVVEFMAQGMNPNDIEKLISAMLGARLVFGLAGAS